MNCSTIYLPSLVLWPEKRNFVDIIASFSLSYYCIHLHSTLPSGISSTSQSFHNGQWSLRVCKERNCRLAIEEAQIALVNSITPLYLLWFYALLFSLSHHVNLPSQTTARGCSSFLQSPPNCRPRHDQSPWRLSSDRGWEMVGNKVDSCGLIWQGLISRWRLCRPERELWEMGCSRRMHQEQRIHGWISRASWILQEEL